MSTNAKPVGVSVFPKVTQLLELMKQRNTNIRWIPVTRIIRSDCPRKACRVGWVAGWVGVTSVQRRNLR